MLLSIAVSRVCWHFSSAYCWSKIHYFSPTRFIYIYVQSSETAAFRLFELQLFTSIPYTLGYVQSSDMKVMKLSADSISTSIMLYGHFCWTLFQSDFNIWPAQIDTNRFQPDRAGFNFLRSLFDCFLVFFFVYFVQVKSNAEVLIDKYYLLIEANQYTYVHMCVRTTNNHVQALILQAHWKSPVDKTDLRCRSIHHSFTHQVYAGCVVHAISSWFFGLISGRCKKKNTAIKRSSHNTINNMHINYKLYKEKQSIYK